MKIVYIAGAGRSGSTLLEQILGSLDGFFCVGELDYIWQRGVCENRLCGCGKPFLDCPTWQAILETAFGQLTPETVQSFLTLRDAVARLRHWPLHRLHRLNITLPGFRRRLGTYTRILTQLYRAIQHVTQAGVLVDSSKRVHGHILARIPGVEMAVIHLVRDSRAVAFSWAREKVYERHEQFEQSGQLGGSTIYMPQFGPLKSSQYWLLDNIGAESLRPAAQYWCRLRYEDFVRQPHETLREVLHDMHEERPLPFVAPRTCVLKPSHSVSGNCMRFESGRVRITADEEWQDAMPASHQALVWGVTGWLLKRYGYAPGLPVGKPAHESV